MRARLFGGRPLGMVLLALEKSVGAVFFLFATIVLLTLELRGITHPLQGLFAAELREDPHDVLANLLIGLLPQVSRRALLALALISAGYLALHVLEALGLWLGRVWVEYLVLVETAALLPYEVYELVRQVTWFKVGVLITNAVIAWYLVGRRVQARASLGDA